MITIRILNAPRDLNYGIRAALKPIAVRSGFRYVGVINGWREALRKVQRQHGVKLHVQEIIYGRLGGPVSDKEVDLEEPV